jgi:hypothetical protein
VKNVAVSATADPPNKVPVFQRGGHSTAADLISHVIALLGLLTIPASVYMMAVSYSALPFWDEWVEIEHPAEGGNPFAFDWLWRQFNEHRMPIPKLFLLVDWKWFHANQVFLLVSIFLIQLSLLGVMVWAIHRFGHWQGALWRTGTGLAAFCIFCLSQWENMTWGMQVCFLLPQLLAGLSFIGLLLYWMHSGESQDRGISGSGYLVLSMAAALGATWSYFSGNVLWPLLIVAAVLLRLRLRVVLSYVVAGVLSTGAYLYGYVHPLNVGSFMRTPGSLLKFFATYFGSSWISSDFQLRFRLAAMIGFIGLLAAVVFLLRFRSYVASRQPLAIFLLLTLAFCLSTGAITSAGRVWFGILWAFNSRYQSIALLFWCCLGLLLLGSISKKTDGRERRLLALQITFLGSMVLGVLNAGTPIIRAQVRGFKLDAAGAALVTGVFDKEELRWVFPHFDYFAADSRYLREEHLSVFDDSKSRLLGGPLQPAFALAASNQCSGGEESSVPIAAANSGNSGLRLTGWAWDNMRREPPIAILLVSHGTITGLGAVGDWRPMHKAPYRWMSGNYLGYTAYTREITDPVQVYAVLRRPRPTACAIGQPQPESAKPGGRVPVSVKLQGG